jgi:hypothetical protein
MPLDLIDDETAALTGLPKPASQPIRLLARKRRHWAGAMPTAEIYDKPKGDLPDHYASIGRLITGFSNIERALNEELRLLGGFENSWTLAPQDLRVAHWIRDQQSARLF